MLAWPTSACIAWIIGLTRPVFDLFDHPISWRDIVLMDSRRTAPIADAPGRDELRLGIDCNPCPNISSLFWSLANSTVRCLQ